MTPRPLLAAAAALVGVAASLVPAAAVVPPPGSPVVMHTGVVTRQDIASRGNSETDTVVEPDVAVSPRNRDVAIAAAHDARFASGGAVDISVSWTHDGGASWHHEPVPGVTKADGGSYDRASDPVVTFGPNGTAYLAVLLFDAGACPSRTAVAVLRSTDGGRTWSAPSFVHRSPDCRRNDDKEWIVVDRGRHSPHRGRIYVFWTMFLARDRQGNLFEGSPQVVRYSDDSGRTWSATHFVSAPFLITQNSQPVVTSSGAVIDLFYVYDNAAAADPDARAPGAAPAARPEAPRRAAVVDNSGAIYAAGSRDGSHWAELNEVAANAAGYAPGVRCCLFAASIDPATNAIYVAFTGAGAPNNSTDPVYLVSSQRAIGYLWTNPVQVSSGDRPGVQRVNVDVVASGRSVYVTYGTRTRPRDNGGFVQQQISVSRDRGRTFFGPSSIGPRSALQFAARARGYFPGDYIGEALAPGRLYVVFARSSRPPAGSASAYHQVIWGVTLRPAG